MSKQRTYVSGLGIIALILGLVIVTPAYALDPNLDLTGPGCPQGLPSITDGCLIAGTYTDANGNDFKINNASSSNPARIQWVEGPINKLILTGVTMVALENVTNATLTFKRKFTSAATFLDTTAVGISVRNSLSGGFNLLYPNQTARTNTATAFVELCMVDDAADTTPGCTPPENGTALAPALVGSITANKTFGSYAPSPDQDDFPFLAFDSKPLLRGQIVISSLRNTEKASNLSQTILAGATASLPPFDSAACNSDDDIGDIIRGLVPEQDTICVKLDEVSFGQMSGADALTLVGSPQCPTIPGETHRPQ